MNNDGKGERNREITQLLQHTNRKHVTRFVIKNTNWVKRGFKGMKGNQENIKEVENTEKDL